MLELVFDYTFMKKKIHLNLRNTSLIGSFYTVDCHVFMCGIKSIIARNGS